MLIRTLSGCLRGGFGGLGGGLFQPSVTHARQLALVGNHQLPCVGGIQHVLAELVGELGGLLMQFGQLLLLFGAQIGTAVLKGIDHLLHITLLFGRKLFHPRAGRGVLDDLPQLLVGVQLGSKGAAFGDKRFLRLAHGGAV